MLTLERNRQWWTTGPLLAADQRVGFPGSGLVWEYYPGQGIEIQWLGTFGAANGLYDTHSYTALAALLNQALSLAARARRRHRLGVRLRASTAARRRGSARSPRAPRSRRWRAPAPRCSNPRLPRRRPPGARHLHAWRRRPGSARPTPAGARYLIYSFAPHEYVINAFIQSLVGLFDLASTGDPLAAQLFRAGNAQALLDLPQLQHRRLVALRPVLGLDAELPRAADRLPREPLRAHARDDADRAGGPRHRSARDRRADRRHRAEQRRPAPRDGTTGGTRRGTTGASGRPARPDHRRDRARDHGRHRGDRARADGPTGRQRSHRTTGRPVRLPPATPTTSTARPPRAFKADLTQPPAITIAKPAEARARRRSRTSR